MRVKGNARDGRSRHQSFRVCKVDLATLEVATKTEKKKEKQKLSLFERFVTEGNERAAGTKWCNQGQHSSAEKRGGVRVVRLAFTVWWRSGTLVKNLNRCRKKQWLLVDDKGRPKWHRKEWCAATSKCLFTRCGRNSTVGWEPKVEGDLVRRVDLTGVMQELFGLCWVPSEVEADEPL